MKLRNNKGQFVVGHPVPREWAIAGYLAGIGKLEPQMIVQRNKAISKARMGHKVSEETRESISNTLKGGYTSGRIAKPTSTLGMKLNSGPKISQALKGKPKPPRTEEHCENIRIARLNAPPASQKTRDKIAEISRKRWQEPGFRDKVVAGMIKAVQSEPNKSEQFLINFFKEHNLPFRYVGDDEFILGGKCPDFLNTDGRKQLIELFGAYWHPIFDVAERTELFKQFGFSLLIIWEDELRDTERLLKKVRTFTRRK